MSETSVFSPRILLIWVSALAAILALSLYLFAYGIGAPETQGVGPSAFSRSAIGYAGLAELLRRANIPVVKKRIGSVSDDSKSNLLIIAEPDVSAGAEANGFALGHSANVLVILPKWVGERDNKHQGWVKFVDAAPENSANWVLSILGVNGGLARGGADGHALSKTLTINDLAIAPALPADLQLIAKSSLTPIVATSAGLLIGEKMQRGRRIWIVSDPDILSNHGLFEGANAQFAGALIEWLHGADGTVIFDETVHGFSAPAANPMRALFEFPFVVVSGYALAALAIVLWSAMIRFGSPERSPVVLKAGKLGLIHNVANLIAFAGGRHDVAVNYLRLAVDDSARRLRAPKALSLERQMEWLDRVGQARGVKTKVAEIAQKLVGQNQDAALSRAALDLHRWKQEILRGP
ncbi:DUF4350 domain-containing protein [Methylocapsa sp. S129]|uniref:DUF4350 domain-containing protein n=1 Tax=Methylocapsa sp. S129 TaxID=1641869 RepID=UPI00131C4322|nr:DUF4350 domain-containing protein [Methylocapsa sp. S129]